MAVPGFWPDFRSYRIPSAHPDEEGHLPQATTLDGEVVFSLFAIVWTSAAFLGTFVDYRSAVSAMQSNQAQVVEGLVTEFTPMPYTGHAMESFVVQGVRFEYSDYVITAGYNNTASHGGPIREGLPVKIWHKGGEILRLDIKKEPNHTVEPPRAQSGASGYSTCVASNPTPVPLLGDIRCCAAAAGHCVRQ